MLHFNELKITPDNKYLIIDVSVDTDEYFNNIEIDKVIIDNQDTYSTSGPSSTPLYTYSIVQSKESPTKELTEQPTEPPINESIGETTNINPEESIEASNHNVDIESINSVTTLNTQETTLIKNVRLILTKQDILDQYAQPVELDKSVFFVYVIAKGTPSPDTPCGLDNSQIVGVAINLCSFYKTAIKYLYELDNECQIPKHFIDMILKFIGLQASIKMGNFNQVIKYWNKFFSRINYSPSYSCKCNG